MNNLYLIRGLPGSGKTTLARELGEVVYEADMYMVVDGEYHYDYKKIGDAHLWCQERTEDAMKVEMPKIAVSNTFVRRWEMEAYYVLAAKYNYQITEITMSGILHQSIHGVPNDRIEQMRSGWEK